MAELADKAAAVVAMSQTAADRMVSLYGVSDSKVRFIPHGTTGFSSPAPFLPSERPTLLTWGLVGPGKGLEYGIEALTHLRDLRPRYVIAGRTHPMVQAVEGEAYRVRLAALAHRLGVEPLGETFELVALFLNNLLLLLQSLFLDPLLALCCSDSFLPDQGWATKTC